MTRKKNAASIPVSTIKHKAKCANGKIAIKVINHYGDEVLKVFMVNN